MKRKMELFLLKEEIEKEKWDNLIHQINCYQGILKSWKIEIVWQNNKIYYYVKLKSLLPPTLNNLEEFAFKEQGLVEEKIKKKMIPTYIELEKSADQIYDYIKVKKKKELLKIEIKITPLIYNKFKSSIFLVIKDKNKIYKKKLLLAVPRTILNISFKKNQRFFRHKISKYLDLQKSIHLFENKKETSLLQIDTFPYSYEEQYLNLNNFSFNKHSLIVGSSGTGKSKFISSLIQKINNYQQKESLYKVMIIDPHASLEKELKYLDNTKTINFQEIESGIDLFLNDTEDTIGTTELLLSLFKNLLIGSYNAKLERVLRYSINLLLTCHNFSFNTLRKLLLELEFRNKILQDNEEILPIQITEFFLTDFNDLKSKSYGEAISPIISFIDEMQLVPVFQKEIKNSNLNTVLENNYLTIFSLDRTKFGDKITKTIASLLMQQLLTVIQTKNFNEHLILIVDEVAVVENVILERLLSEARKYGLSLILAGQYLSQVSSSLQNAIFANTVNYFTFRISKMDATLLSDMLEMELVNDNTKEKKIQVLTELADRECIARIQNNGKLIPAFRGKTLDFTIDKKEIVIKKYIQNLNISIDSPTSQYKKIKLKKEIIYE